MAISGSNLVRHIPESLSPEMFAVRIDAGLVYWHGIYDTVAFLSVDVNLVQEDSLSIPCISVARRSRVWWLSGAKRTKNFEVLLTETRMIYE
jgi:hypothetical protein